MPSLSSPLLPWSALGLATIVWGTIVYGVWTAQFSQSEREAQMVETERATLEQSAALRLHALARETKEARETLERIADMDVVEILDVIEGVARDSKIPIQIGQALSEPASGSSPIRAVSFMIQVQGSFAEVLRAMALLESLPIASSVAEIHLERLPEATRSGRALWRGALRVRFFTTADIAS